MQCDINQMKDKNHMVISTVSPHRFLLLKPFSSHVLPPSRSSVCLLQCSSHSLLLSPSSSFPASYSPPFSSPPHHFIPVSISPRSRSSDFLPRFCLPAPSSLRFLYPPPSPPVVFSPTPFSALSHCLSPRSPPRVHAPVSLRPACLCAQAAPELGP